VLQRQNISNGLSTLLLCSFANMLPQGLVGAPKEASVCRWGGQSSLLHLP